MAQPKVTSYDEIKEILQVMAERHVSQDRTLITVRSVKAELKVQKGKEVATDTLRDYGVCQSGYFQKKYPDVFSYQSEGNPKNWGLVMKPEKYLREVRDYGNAKINELKQDSEKVEA